MYPRIIARLDIKGPDLVKGIQLEGLRVLGSPSEFARHYYEQGADELLYMDVVASLYQRNSLRDLIERTAQEIFIPLAVGGGLRSIDDMRAVLRSGADKVVINTAAIADPKLITAAAKVFGSSTIVVAIEAIPEPDGRYFAYTDNGRNATGVEVLSWAKQVEELGAGEIILTAVTREGTGKGFDIPLIHSVAAAVSIPVVAHGGCGKAEDVGAALIEGHADAVAVASVLHYQALKEGAIVEQTNLQGNTSFLQNAKASPRQGCSIASIKQHLQNSKIPCRL
jgi:cyclase